MADPAAGQGLLVPQLGQNLPSRPSVPQVGHFQGPAAGLGVPHSPQNLPVRPVVPQLGQVQEPAGAIWGAAC